MKKTLSLALALLLCLSLFSLAQAEEPEVITLPDGSAIDLGGMEIIVGDWWSSGEETEPTTAQEEATADYRAWIQDTYNFKIKQQSVSSWDGIPEFFTNFATSGGAENYVIIMRPGTLAAPMNSGLFYDLASLGVFDFEDSKWNSATTSLMTKGESIYGMRPLEGEPREGVFFNKRLLTEAGVDPESLYEMQAAGTWNWAAFEELCAKLTRDLNNDGTVDVYALTSFGPRFIGASIASNGGEFVGIDENGKYFNATGSDNFMEAANWAAGIISKYEYPQPEGSNWDYAEAAFYNGEVAMSIHQDYFASTLYQNMEDDYGFVAFPKGPKNETYVNVWTDNVYVIPACYDADRAWKIAFAFNLFTNPTPGYDDEDDWKTGFYAKYRDTRSVDETIAMLRSDDHAVTWLEGMVSGYDLGPDFYWDVAALAMTPAEKLESVKAQWQAYLDAANGQ
ncbi:MAG: extracellular solute-binding protein [Oscillospiraceae bacterium]|jgi:maltose-binding protein MalE|nr:extracellular solute-binding protein [Oscillospiraceae bacterium]